MASSNQDNQGNPGKQNQGGGSQDDHQGDDRGSRNQSALLHKLTAGQMSPVVNEMAPHYFCAANLK